MDQKQQTIAQSMTAVEACAQKEVDRHTKALSATDEIRQFHETATAHCVHVAGEVSQRDDRIRELEYCLGMTTSEANSLRTKLEAEKSRHGVIDARDAKEAARALHEANERARAGDEPGHDFEVSLECNPGWIDMGAEAVRMVANATGKLLAELEDVRAKLDFANAEIERTCERMAEAAEEHGRELVAANERVSSTEKSMKTERAMKDGCQDRLMALFAGLPEHRHISGEDTVATAIRILSEQGKELARLSAPPPGDRDGQALTLMNAYRLSGSDPMPPCDRLVGEGLKTWWLAVRDVAARMFAPKTCADVVAFGPSVEELQKELAAANQRAEDIVNDRDALRAILTSTTETTCSRLGCEDRSATCITRNDPKSQWCRHCLAVLLRNPWDFGELPTIKPATAAPVSQHRSAPAPHVVRTVDRCEGHEVVTFSPTSAADQNPDPYDLAGADDCNGAPNFRSEPTLYPTPELDRVCREMGLEKLPSSVHPESDSVAACVMIATQFDIAAAVKPWKERAELAEVQLAGCGVAALGYAKPGVEGGDCKQGDWGWSASFGDVKKLREDYETALKRIAELERGTAEESGTRNVLETYVPESERGKALHDLAFIVANRLETKICELEEQRNEWTGRATDMASKVAGLEAQVTELGFLQTRKDYEDTIAQQKERIGNLEYDARAWDCLRTVTPDFGKTVAETIQGKLEAAERDLARLRELAGKAQLGTIGYNVLSGPDDAVEWRSLLRVGSPEPKSAPPAPAFVPSAETVSAALALENANTSALVQECSFMLVFRIARDLLAAQAAGKGGSDV